MDSTYEIVRKVLDFIDSSPYKTGYSFSPINEPADPLGQLFVVGKMLSPNGTSYVLRSAPEIFSRSIFSMLTQLSPCSYFQWVVGAFKARNPKIPVVLSDCYMNPVSTQSAWHQYESLTLNTPSLLFSFRPFPFPS